MNNSSAAKALYGILFVAVLPCLLVLWARETETVVHLRAIHSFRWGMVTLSFGALLILWGMSALWRRGGGLPMNAFPPPRYVSTGIYGLLRHPIYAGFAFLCAGVSIASGSASGLWLVTPIVALASTALVMGYEIPDMQARFGTSFPKQRFLPPDNASPPSAEERLRCYVTVLLPWLLLYEAVVALGVSHDARPAYLGLEYHLPVWQWTESLYVSIYAVVALTPLLVPSRHRMRWFSVRGLVSMAIVFPIFLVVPLIAPPRAFVADGIWGTWLNFDRAHDSVGAAFPSYHVIWAFLSAEVIGRTRWQTWLARIWALLVCVSCITTGMHALVDVLGGFLVVWLVIRIEVVWTLVRRGCEGIANSWQEWRMGPLRIINHGAYAALGVFLGILVIDTLLGPGKGLISISIFAGGTIGAALWAQWVEGSPSLLRPLGFYGGMIGTSAGGILASRSTGTDIWLVLSALVVAAPWIQGLGRLRCLVQGCCHGRLADEVLGIRYVHPRSRVYRIESLRGVPVHPTPLYSLLWNVAVGMAVTRLYLLHTTAAMVGGIYLILSGLGRFVEEAYRGEPQTKILWGLRLYQWIAIGTVGTGAFITTLHNTPPAPAPMPHLSSLLVAGVCGILAWIVTAVDFPESNRRFARLTQ